ncbi:MAG TPA: acyl-CoA dehydrogenase family protein [Ramlibacter sp.]|nr:acyl-CoA dehydrogenase family protein [Ramlibacter sp.]
MDAVLENPDELEAFRQEVRAFIRAALPEELRLRAERGYDLLTREDHTLWQRRLYDRGWAAPSWPVEYGGTGWSPARRQVFDEECGRASCPRTQPQGIKLVGPILYSYGTAQQKERFLQPILRADEWWCQGYSEPNAGSDLAALQTRAVREGDHYRVTGQKVWTTLAHWADWMFCLVRTSSEGRRQDGITFLLIDMKAPGVRVRPIVTLDVAHHFNEVFLDDVRVPVSQRIGEEGQGWRYAKALLVHERAGIAELGRARERLDRLKRIAREPSINGGSLLRDAGFRAQAAQLEVEVLAAEATTLRLQQQGGQPALSSLLKLRGSELSQRLSRLNLEALGPHAIRLDLEQAERGPRQDDPLPSFAIGRGVEYLRWRAATLAGGTSEIQRDLIARLAFDARQEPPAGGALQEAVERFVREHYTLPAWRESARTAPGFRETLWRSMAGLGWLATTIPEDCAGLGLGPGERAVLMEGIGRGPVLEPYWSTAVFGAELVRAAGSASQRHSLLEPVARGELRLAVALHEPGARYDWTQVDCRAVRDGHGWRLSGSKVAVLDAAHADRLLLLARREADGELGIFCIEARAAGLSRRDYPTLDERRCSDLRLDGVPAAAADLLEAAPAAAAMQQAIDHALVALGAEAVGAMAMLLQATVDYLQARRQFGRPLAEFQVLRHRVADMLMATEQTRSLVLLAADRVRDDAPDRSRLAAAVKVQAGQAGRFVGESAVQLHGAVGVTDELPVGHWFKRLLTIDFLLGDAAFHLGRIADLDPELAPAD